MGEELICQGTVHRALNFDNKGESSEDWNTNKLTKTYK